MSFFKRSIFSVLTAFVLILAIPFTSCFAVGNFSLSDENLKYYKSSDGTQNVMSTKNQPGFHYYSKDFESCGYIHCTNGSWKSFFLWIPFFGIYYCVLQNTLVPKDITFSSGGQISNYAFYTIIEVSSGSRPYYQLYSLDGGWSPMQDLNNYGRLAGLHDFFGQYVFLYPVRYVDSSEPPQRLHVSGTNLGSPSKDIVDKLKEKAKSLDSRADGGFVLDGDNIQPSETLPDGSPAPTNENGNPAPTNQFGQTVPTLPNGKAWPTWPNGQTAPTVIDDNGNYETVPYSIYDNGANDNDVKGEFSKINGMISDMDNLESMMLSNQDDLSGHVDNTRELVNSVINWFPPAVIAVLVCGAIMIIAVKISGSGKS